MDWNAEQYHKVSEPQFEWGLQVLSRVAALPLRGDEAVLDAGCGTGRLTLHLAELFPRGQVVGSDVSAPMLKSFAAELNGKRESAGQHIGLVLADFQALPFLNSFDLIFSTAAFHWAADHDALFASIYQALRPTGRLVAQCGGGANLAAVRERAAVVMRDPAFAPFFREWRPAWNYADVPATKRRLVDVGFVDAEVWLENSPVTMKDAASYRAFAETVVERTQVGMIPDPAMKGEYLDRVLDLAAGDFTFDYVRLNINAQKS